MRAPRLPSRARRLTARLAWALLVGALWLGVTEPWGLGVFELLAFLAPGALMGLAASWIAAALSPARWRWRDGLRGAALGAAFLPPVFAFMVALAGVGRPARTLEALVLFAWLALGAGASAGLAGFVWRLLRRRLHPSARHGRRKSRTTPSLPSAIASGGERRWFTPGRGHVPREGP